MKFENTEVFNIPGALRGMRNPLESWDKSDSFYCKDVVSCDCCDLEEACDKGETLLYDSFSVGKKDIELGQRLIKGGSEHRKFLRQIMVSVDITAPLYFYKEFDTYKVGTVANSTSTMHRLMSSQITTECFEMDDYPTRESCNLAMVNAIRNFQKDINMEDQYQSTIVDIFDLAETQAAMCEILRKSYISCQNGAKDTEKYSKLEREQFSESAKLLWKMLVRFLPCAWLQTRTCTLTYENLYTMIRQRKDHKLTEWRVEFINWCKTLPLAKEFLFYGLEDLYDA